MATIDDTDIVTEMDQLFCANKPTLKNQDITPDQLPDNGSVWRIGNRRWSDIWETKYQNWVKKNVQADFFQKINLPTDCADAAIAIRAIFSRIYNLPTSFASDKNGNRSKHWSKVETVKDWRPDLWQEDFKKDKRFLAALTEWMRGTGTKNLSKDTYQIEITDADKKITSECIAPGTVVLDYNHAQILTFNDQSIFPYKLSSSTIPAEVRPLASEPPRIYSTQVIGNTKKAIDIRENQGYLGWNWEVNCSARFSKVKDELMPYFSADQRKMASINSESEYQELKFSLNDAYQESLGLTEEEIKTRLTQEAKLLLEEIKDQIEARKKYVTDGAAACHRLGIKKATDCFKASNRYNFLLDENGLIQIPDTGNSTEDQDQDEGGCINCFPEELYSSNFVNTENILESFSPLNPELEEFYNMHSTPSRDQRLERKVEEYNRILYHLPWEEKERFDTELLQEFMSLEDGKQISYYHIIEGVDGLSPQPWDSKDLRWGAATMQESKHYFQKYAVDLLKRYKALIDTNDKDKVQAFKLKYPKFIAEKNAIDAFFID